MSGRRVRLQRGVGGGGVGDRRERGSVEPTSEGGWSCNRAAWLKTGRERRTTGGPGPREAHGAGLGGGPPPNSTRSFECSRTWTHHQAVLIDRDIRDVLSAHEPSEGAKTSGQATFLKRVAPSQEEPPAVREVFRKKPPSSQETRPHACRFP